MWTKVSPHVKNIPYVINQNTILKIKYCVVISGWILANYAPKHSELSIF